jgi:DNA-binding beta-propeller fold protein YncE
MKTRPNRAIASITGRGPISAGEFEAGQIEDGGKAGLLSRPQWSGSGVLVILAVSLCCGCATTTPTAQERVWPEPPARARIKYVRSIYGAEEFQRSLFGRLLPAPSAARIQKPYGVFADGKGRLYIADTARGLVMVLDYEEEKAFFIGARRDQGRLAKPVSVVAGSDERIYVTDVLQKRVVVYDRGGKFVLAIGRQGEFERPTGIALNEERGLIYVSDTPRHVVKVYDLEGNFRFEFRGDNERKIAFHHPTNIWIDEGGQVYITDSMNFRVMVFDADGRYLKNLGRIGTLPGMFARPKGVAVDYDGNVYVVDAMFHNVQVFDQQGQVLLVFGEHGGHPGGFWLPAGICIDKNGVIYVSDSFNHRIQVFQYIP